MTATRERAINLRDWEVWAIQAGRLKLLVRPVKPQPESVGPNSGQPIREVVPSLLANRGDLFDVRYDGDNPIAIRCPFGKPGDRLRGREVYGYAWMNEQEVQESIELGEGPSLFYRADWPNQKVQPSIADRWLSSSRMPRWAVRNWLEITEVRCGRVREMSEYDGWDCGIQVMEQSAGQSVYRWYGIDRPLAANVLSAVATLYETDYGVGAWDRNDWVWMIGVKRIEGGV